MRPLKFRAFVNNGIIEGHEAAIYPVSGLDFDSNGKLMRVSCHSQSIRAEHVELMQFTGMYDKNYKEIYEGDLLKTLYWNDGRPGAECIGHVISAEGGVPEVKWVSGKPYYAVDFLADYASASEIVGNIYQDKE